MCTEIKKCAALWIIYTLKSAVRRWWNHHHVKQGKPTDKKSVVFTHILSVCCSSKHSCCFFYLHLFTHSFFCCLSGSESHRQQSQNRCPDLLLLAMFPSHLSDVISPSCPGSSSEPPSGGTCQKYLTWSDALTAIFLLLMWRSSGSTLSPSRKTNQTNPTYPISKAELGHRLDGVHFWCLYLQSYSFGHFSQT